MKASKTFTKIAVGMFAAFAVAFSGVDVTLAHVVVKPGEVATATYQVFTVSVPNEKDISTVSVKVVIPEGMQSVTPTNKPGWTVATEKNSTNDGASVASITWSGGEIADGLRDEFTFSAKTPDEATEMQWKAYQTYADGTVVSWDQTEDDNAHGEGTTSGPLSVTNVVADVEASSGESDAVVADAQASADRALYVAVIGVVLGLVAVFLATQKSKK